MGLSVPAFLIDVRKDQLGAATSTIQFSRSIGGTLDVSLLDPLARASATFEGPLRQAHLSFC